jgi:hypothetical protein
MLRVFGNRHRKRPADEIDMVRITSVNDNGDPVKIKASFKGKTLNEVTKFAREKGYTMMKELLPILFSYGVTEREGVDIEKRRLEVFVLGGKYAAMTFEAYQQFADNRALTMALSSMLPENKRLRELAEQKGLAVIKKEDWDDWNQEKIDSYYKKYVFVR